MKRPHKYGAQPTEIVHKGKEIRCASKLEAKHLSELCIRERAGEISALEFHPRYRLAGGVVYEADAQFVERVMECGVPQSARLVVFEVKGFATAAWRIKQKLFAAAFPTTELRIVKARASAGGRR